MIHQPIDLKNFTVTAENSFTADVNGELFDVDLAMIPSPGAAVDIAVGGAVIQYDGQRLTCSGPGDAVWRANIRPDAEGRISLRILKDRTTVEIFGNGGLVYMPIFALFDQEQRSFQVAVSNGTCSIERLAVNTLKSIWEK